MPKGPLDLFVDARTAELLGESDRAANLYVELIEEGGEGVAGFEGRAASSAIAAGRFDLALELAKTADLSDANLDLRMLLLADALRGARWAEALAIVNDDTTRVSLDFMAPFVRSWIDVATARGGREPTGPSRLAGLSRQRPLSRQIEEQAALLYLAAGRVEPALPLIDEAIARAGGREARMRMAFAESLYSLGRPDAAMALLAGDDAMLVEARERLQAGETLGMAIRTPAEGLSELLIAVAVDLTQGRAGDLPLLLAQVGRFADPANESADIITGALMDRVGRSEEALDLYRGVADSSPLILQARDSVIQGLLNADQAEEALAIARADREAHPGRAGGWARIGDTLMALERPDEAADAYARERGMQAEPEWQLLFLEALARHDAGDWDTARSLLRSALAISPEEPVLLNYYGYALLERDEELDRAFAYIRNASNIQPDNPAITDSLGWALYKNGELAEAADVLERAARLSPDDPEIHEHYGDALYATGNPIEARFAWEAALVFAEEMAMVERLEDKLGFGLSERNEAP
nr:tetratricopeptide repeat protein [Sphingomicrobium sediminis]